MVSGPIRIWNWVVLKGLGTWTQMCERTAYNSDFALGPGMSEIGGCQEPFQELYLSSQDLLSATCQGSLQPVPPAHVRSLDTQAALS